MQSIKLKEVLEANGLKVVESPEWLWVVLDAEDHILFGIKHDGAVEWFIGVPEPIKKEMEELKRRIQQLESKIK